MRAPRKSADGRVYIRERFMKNAAKLLLLAISMATGCLVQAAPV